MQKFINENIKEKNGFFIKSLHPYYDRNIYVTQLFRNFPGNLGRRFFKLFFQVFLNQNTFKKIDLVKI
jgi:hypothetical protein